MPKTAPIDFQKLVDLEDLPRWLGVEAAKIQDFLNNTDAYYKKVRLTKRRSSKLRIVYEVQKELAALQRHIARSIARTRMGVFSEHVQGYVAGRSTATNAGMHKSKGIVLCVDLKDFFGSIHSENVRNAFRLLGSTVVTSEVLAKLCTLNNYLPQGASTSPILSNIVVRRLDDDMLQLSSVFQCAYSRYSDDLTFSGDSVPTPQQIDDVVQTHGFSVNHSKTRCQRRGRRQYVTGLTVCDQVRPRVPRPFKKNLRLALHWAEKLGLEEHYKNTGESPQKLLGRICYVNGIEPELGERFFEQYNRAVDLDAKRRMG